MKEKKKIIFVCVHNAARSQMAEGILRDLYGGSYQVFSAGTEPTTVHPLAVQAMHEIGIDISGHKAKRLDSLKDEGFDLAVTLCGSRAACPYVAGARATVHREFADPGASPDIESFRKVRDQLHLWIREEFPDPGHLPEEAAIPLMLPQED